MAATSGLFAAVATDLINHLTPNTSGTVATAVVVTAPLKMQLTTTTSTSGAAGTVCADANYTTGGQPVTTWNAATTVAGAGYGAGYSQKTNATVLNFPAGGTSTGFAAQATLAGLFLVSADPTNVAYYNFSASVVVPQGNVYQWAAAAFQLQIS